MLLFNTILLLATAYFCGRLFKKFHLPPLLAYLFIGILAGTSIRQLLPSFDSLLQWFTLAPESKSASPYLRTFALTIILLRAGLSFQKATLIKIGRSAALMSTIPLAFEAGIAYLASIYFLNFAPLEAAILAFALAAVSPAVIIPQMLILKAKGIGNKKDVPSLVLASASVDDILTLTFFYAVLGLGMHSATESSLWMKITAIPVSITAGAIGGILVGMLLVKLLPFLKEKTSWQTVLVLIAATVLDLIEKTHYFPFASIIAIIAFGFWLNEKNHHIASRIAGTLKHIWFAGEIILFVLIGAEVEIAALADCGLYGLIILILGLLARSAGVWFSLLGSVYNKKERLFCIFAFLPKATVQAAIGGIALSYMQNGTMTLPNGLASAETILAIAVLSIVVAAPLGAGLISLTAENLLKDTGHKS